MLFRSKKSLAAIFVCPFRHDQYYQSLDADTILIYTWKKRDTKTKKMLRRENLRKFRSHYLLKNPKFPDIL